MHSTKFPRTLEEAFGPYTSHEIEDATYPKYRWGLLLGKALATAAFAGYVIYLYNYL